MGIFPSGVAGLDVTTKLFFDAESNSVWRLFRGLELDGPGRDGRNSRRRFSQIAAVFLLTGSAISPGSPGTMLLSAATLADHGTTY